VRTISSGRRSSPKWCPLGGRETGLISPIIVEFLVRSQLRHRVLERGLKGDRGTWHWGFCKPFVIGLARRLLMGKMLDWRHLWCRRLRCNRRSRVFVYYHFFRLGLRSRFSFSDWMGRAQWSCAFSFGDTRIGSHRARLCEGERLWFFNMLQGDITMVNLLTASKYRL
jgi:hypothetical protein